MKNVFVIMLISFFVVGCHDEHKSVQNETKNGPATTPDDQKTKTQSDVEAEPESQSEVEIEKEEPLATDRSENNNSTTVENQKSGNSRVPKGNEKGLNAEYQHQLEIENQYKKEFDEMNQKTELAKKQLEEDLKHQAEVEKQHKAEEEEKARKAEEEEMARKAELAKKQLEDESKRQAEVKKQHKAEEEENARKAEEEEKARQTDLAKKKLEEETRLQAEIEAKCKLEAEEKARKDDTDELAQQELLEKQRLKLLQDKTEILVSAVLDGNLEKITAILDDGADINLRNKYGYSPLYSSIRFEKINSEIVSLLLKRGANPNEKISVESLRNVTLLNFAIYFNRIEVVQLLLNNRADPIMCDWSGHTPLYNAAKYGRTNIVDMLFDSSKRVFRAIDILDLKVGQTALGIALENKQVEIIKILLRNRANPELLNKNSTDCRYSKELWTLLHDIQSEFSFACDGSIPGQEQQCARVEIKGKNVCFSSSSIMKDIYWRGGFCYFQVLDNNPDLPAAKQGHGPSIVPIESDFATSKKYYDLGITNYQMLWAKVTVRDVERTNVCFDLTREVAPEFALGKIKCIGYDNNDHPMVELTGRSTY